MLAEEDDASAERGGGPGRSSRITDLGSVARSERAPRSTEDAALHPVDRELLEHLERRFAEVAGADERISVAELGRALCIRSEELARRMLVAFDRNRDGDVDTADFLGCVRRLLLGTTRDRLLFAFRVHDVDGDAYLTRRELESLIALGLAEDSVVHPPGEPSRLATLLLRRADRDKDGRLSFVEFADAIGSAPEILRQVTTSGACWLAPNEARMVELAAALPRTERARRWIENHAVEIAVLSVWAALHAVLWAHADAVYAHANRYIRVARGAAACIYLDSALVLLPVMRGLLTFMQGKRRLWSVSFGNAVGFHRLLGATLVVLALVHTAAHVANVAVTERGSLLAALVAPGARRTGVEWLAVLLVMGLFASKRMRRFRFDTFHATHLMFPLWFAIGLSHARTFALWTALPLVAYGVERALRYGSRTYTSEVLELLPLRSGVTRLLLERPAEFAAKAGQYLFLRLPAVARHEWHPFTISSAPEHPHLTLHVRALGDFSSDVRRLAEARSRSGDRSRLVAELDGPYGAPCVDVEGARRVLLIAGGIGVTPFASILESLLHRLKTAPESVTFERVDFFWLNRDQYSFEWFAELLGRLTAADGGTLVHVHVFMTGARADAACAALNLALGLSREGGGPDPVTGLALTTHMGEPAWADELDSIVKAAGEVPVRAFFCGPEGLGNKLSLLCDARGVDFRRETF